MDRHDRPLSLHVCAAQSRAAFQSPYIDEKTFRKALLGMTFN